MGSTIVHVGAFFRGEIVATLRQPRLLLTLVVGPFLVLFVFGIGYEEQLPTLSTLVVASEGDLTDRVEAYIGDDPPVEIDYQGTTDDEDQALDALRAGQVDLVIVLPEDALEVISRDERAVIEIHQRSLDPVTFTQIAIASTSAVSEINDQVLEEALASAQEGTEEYGDRLEQAREQLDLLRSAVADEDLLLAQRTAGQLAPQLEEVATALESAAGPASLFRFGDEVNDLVEALRGGARQLERVSRIDGVGSLDEVQTSLAELDDVVTEVQAVDPAVAVRPFAAEVVSQTPVPVTLDRFYAPGLVALMLQHLGITFAALALVRERRTGTLEMLRVAPVTTGERLAGKSAAFLLLGGVMAVVLTALVVVVFEVPAPVDWLVFSGLVALTLLASLGIGYLIASVSATDSQAVQFSMLLLLAAIFFSGLFMPLDRIGMPVEIVSWLLPATYLFVGLQQLMLLAMPADLLLFAGLTAITIVTFTAARVLLPRRAATD
jgi:ABC-2 type transport system permease protein